jgi:ADP-ribose pyrophosphatase YjhB (NUDIX family)
MTNLSEVSTGELLTEAANRPDDLVNPDNGFLSREAFALQDTLGTRVCVDGAPGRVNENGEVELMAIDRGTGPYAGRLCLVGGGVGRVNEKGQLVPERIDEALKRHFKRDLGFNVAPATSWNTPQHIGQDMRPDENGELRDGFTPNPDSRHLIAMRYLVKVVDHEGNQIQDPKPEFGSTIFGQEASDIVWFTEDQMPEDPNAWGYGHNETYQAMFRAANNLWLPA